MFAMLQVFTFLILVILFSLNLSSYAKSVTDEPKSTQGIEIKTGIEKTLRPTKDERIRVRQKNKSSKYYIKQKNKLRKMNYQKRDKELEIEYLQNRLDMKKKKLDNMLIEASEKGEM